MDYRTGYQKGNTRQRRETARRRRILIAVIVVLLLLVTGIFLNVRKNGFRKDGIALYESGQYQAALDVFAQGEQAKAPFSAAITSDMQWYQASCYLMLGDFEQAESVYNTMPVSTRDKERVTLCVNISAALARYAQGDYAQAADELAKYAGTDCAALYLYLGSCYMELGSYDEMQQAFAAYQELGHDSDYLHALLASYDISIGQYEQALTEIAQGLALGGGCTRMLLWQEICCLEYQRDFNAAYAKMQVYAQTYPLMEQETHEWNFLQTVYTGE